ncbi:dienelactone hydrolase family protein [Sporolactobacillus pectinivorans]|uniref:dienelactone hydrolase family protein n=1 Tax=Sporolactobacillus pectinivorans TaxID=1591408 RepID=UPI000C26148C|nr:dienelactone hydrolase family protein [Sporolactobacillus pectinivorans]
MLTYIRNRRKLVILIHEIYGVNEQMHLFAQWLDHLGTDVVCPDLLSKEEPFKEFLEEEAYQYFMNHVGFEKGSIAINRIIHQFQNKYDDIYLIGFSVGATIAWIYSAQSRSLKGVICFYGSRIRDYDQLDPKCPVTLFLAHDEKSFSVDDFIIKLKDRNYENVDLHLLEAKHGFANPFSEQFDDQVYQQALAQVKSMLKQLS